MTLQQLEYIIAVEQHGYFVNAADVWRDAINTESDD